MSYGEYGGNGSVQSAVWLGEPDVQVTQLNRGAEAWAKLGEAQLSRRHGRSPEDRSNRPDVLTEKTTRRPGLATSESGSDSRMGRNHEGGGAFRRAICARELEVEFNSRVVKDSPGQIKIAWGAHANETSATLRRERTATPATWRLMPACGSVSCDFSAERHTPVFSRYIRRVIFPASEVRNVVRRIRWQRQRSLADRRGRR